MKNILITINSQLFHVKFDDINYPYLPDLSTNLWKCKEEIGRIKNKSITSMCLSPIAGRFTKEDLENTTLLRLHDKGYIDNDCYSNGKDTDLTPFIVRKENVPEFTIHFGYENKPYIKSGYGGDLNKWQKEAMLDLFSDESLKVAKKQLKPLIKHTIKQYKTYLISIIKTRQDELKQMAMIAKGL
jgi:hypothetical protein